MRIWRSGLSYGLWGSMLCCILLGCSSPPGGSPEAVFDAARKAIERKDHQTYVACLTHESIDLVATGLVLSLHSTRAGLEGREGPESEELVQRIDSILIRHDISDLEGKQLDNKMLVDTIKSIKDRSAFVADAMTTIGELGDGQTISNRLGDAKLTDVRISGDSATAKLVAPESPPPSGKNNKRNDKVTISFRKEAGRWRIHLVRPEQGDG